MLITPDHGARDPEVAMSHPEGCEHSDADRRERTFRSMPRPVYCNAGVVTTIMFVPKITSRLQDAQPEFHIRGPNARYYAVAVVMKHLPERI